MDLLNNIKPEYNSICRICLTESEDMKNINSTNFEYCTGIDISETPLSTQICSKCENSLNDFYIFKEKCVESHNLLIGINGNITESIDIDSNFKIELFEESNVDEIDEAVENAQAEEEELLEVLMICEDNEISSDDGAAVMESDISDFEYATSPKINEESETDPTNCEKQKLDNVKKIKTKTVEKEKRKVICEQCGKSYSTTYYSTHKKTHNHNKNTEEDAEVKCNKCEKTFKNKKDRHSHAMKMHYNIVYACKLCDKSFKYWTTRRSHMVFAHGESYRYNCTICPFKTQSSSTYTNHIRSHSGEKPVKCTQCSKTFSSNTYLKSHMATHSNEKNFICEYCNKSFSLMKHLRAHIKIHTQERNYVCPVDSCGKSFIQNHVLKSHMKANHPEVEIPPAGTIVSIKPKINLRKQ